jgi:hypothetical protein
MIIPSALVCQKDSIASEIENNVRRENSIKTISAVILLASHLLSLLRYRLSKSSIINKQAFAEPSIQLSIQASQKKSKENQQDVLNPQPTPNRDE